MDAMKDSIQEVFGEVIYSYTVEDGIGDGWFIPLFSAERRKQLAGGANIVATATVREAYSDAAMAEMWNEYVLWLQEGNGLAQMPFRNTMNGRTVLLSHDGGVPGTHTLYFPEDD